MLFRSILSYLLSSGSIQSVDQSKTSVSILACLISDCNTLTLTHSYQLLHTDTPGDCPCPPHKLSVLMYGLSAPRVLLLSFYQLRKIFPQGMHFCRCWKTVKKHYFTFFFVVILTLLFRFYLLFIYFIDISNYLLF